MKRRAERDIRKTTDPEHVLLSGDFYVGQDFHTTSAPVKRFVWHPVEQRMIYQDVQYPKGLLKVFDEALVNAADNSMRTEAPTRRIFVHLQTQPFQITVENDGGVFPLVETEHDSLASGGGKATQAELAFFHCKTSSNYGKKKKTTGGKYGLGAKLMSIVSHQSTLTVCDGQTWYQQTSRQHMHVIDRPHRKPAPKKYQDKPFLRISFQPDLTLFYPPGEMPVTLDPVLIPLMLTRILDVAGTTDKAVKVTYQVDDGPKQRPPANTFKDYLKLFLPPELTSELESSKERLKVEYLSVPRWEVCLIKNPYDFPVSVSFVNNINTYLGGEHVKYIQSQLYTYLKTKLPGLDARRAHLSTMLFINARIEDPSFNAQSKETLLTVPKAFGSTCVLPDKFLGVMTRNGVIDGLKANLLKKELAAVQREIGAKKVRHLHDVPKLDDADWAGTRKSSLCSLILTEGDSAKNLANVGREMMGAERFGTMALRGVGINAEKSMDKLTDNKELKYLCKALGLPLGGTVERSQLRYGRVVLMCDQDKDGRHIIGLLVFMFQKWWPNLLQQPDFLSVMITPFLVATKGKQERVFYSEPEYLAWWQTLTESQQRGWQAKHYKGLGTSTTQEAKTYFRAYRQLCKPFAPPQEEDVTALELLYAKKAKEDRKAWLLTYDHRVFFPYATQVTIPIRDFVLQDHCHFSWEWAYRSLPAVEDGLKPTQRKIVYTLLQRNHDHEEKVSILGADVSKSTNYHHGEASMHDTIVGLAQHYCGKQNINVLAPNGQFGSRIDAKAASPRYIFTGLKAITRYLFPRVDQSLYAPHQDEGQVVEPWYLLPIIPLVFTFGYASVTNGFATKSPAYRPEEVVAVIRQRLHQQPYVWPNPWVNKFTGSIVVEDDMVRITGCAHPDPQQPRVWHITEIPYTRLVNAYNNCEKKNKKGEPTAVLNRLLFEGKITDFTSRHQGDRVHFVVTVAENVKVEDPLTFFHLKDSFRMSWNLIEHGDDQPRIVTLTRPEEVFERYVTKRLALYETRRQTLLQQSADEAIWQNVKHQFLSARERLPWGQPSAQWRTFLQTTLHIPENFHSRLLDLATRSFTEEKVTQALRDQQEALAQHSRWERETATTLWLQDLDVLAKHWEQHWQETQM